MAIARALGDDLILQPTIEARGFKLLWIMTMIIAGWNFAVLTYG